MSTLSATAPQVALAPERKTSFNVELGHLRAFVIALVVAHHSVLAYFISLWS